MLFHCVAIQFGFIYTYFFRAKGPRSAIINNVKLTVRKYFNVELVCYIECERLSFFLAKRDFTITVLS